MTQTNDLPQQIRKAGVRSLQEMLYKREDLFVSMTESVPDYVWTAGLAAVMDSDGVQGRKLSEPNAEEVRKYRAGTASAVKISPHFTEKVIPLPAGYIPD